MDKICTRCSFRNPVKRAVCQVCGHSKFSTMEDSQPVEAVTTNSFAEFFAQTKAAAVRSFEAFTSSLKYIQLQPTATNEKAQTNNVSTMSLPQPVEEMRVFSDGEDLDSMIAWFKSYGVDRPLILEPKPLPVRHNSRAA